MTKTHQPSSPHTLRSTNTVQREAVNEMALLHALAMCFQNRDCLDWILRLAFGRDRLHTRYRVHRHLREELRVQSDNLRRHGGFGGIDDGILANSIHLDGAVISNELA